MDSGDYRRANRLGCDCLVVKQRQVRRNAAETIEGHDNWCRIDPRMNKDDPWLQRLIICAKSDWLNRDLI